jgi:hypothetical protein
MRSKDMVALMTTPRMLATAAAIAIAALTSGAVTQAASRPPIKDCGDVATLDADNFFNGAITAQGGSCKNARAIASTVARSAGCKSRGSCRVRTYTCLLAKAGKELTLVRCENSRQTAFVRFEFGS